jgi:hypothetical protein
MLLAIARLGQPLTFFGRALPDLAHLAPVVPKRLSPAVVRFLYCVGAICGDISNKRAFTGIRYQSPSAVGGFPSGVTSMRFSSAVISTCSAG